MTYLPAELNAELAAIIKNNSDVEFVSVETGKSGGYYAVFAFPNGHKIEALIGYTKAEKAAFPTKGVYYS